MLKVLSMVSVVVNVIQVSTTRVSSGSWSSELWRTSTRHMCPGRVINVPLRMCAGAFRTLSPKSLFVVVVSKTCTTAETMLNARQRRNLIQLVLFCLIFLVFRSVFVSCIFPRTVCGVFLPMSVGLVLTRFGLPFAPRSRLWEHRLIYRTDHSVNDLDPTLRPSFIKVRVMWRQTDHNFYFI